MLSAEGITEREAAYAKALWKEEAWKNTVSMKDSDHWGTNTIIVGWTESEQEIQVKRVVGAKLQKAVRAR